MPVFLHDGPSLRLDLALAQSPLGISRREARRLLGEARVVVNGTPLSVASREIRRGDRVAVQRDEPDVPLLELSRDRVVIDKPPGLAAQLPRREGPLSSLELVLAQLKRAGADVSLWVVHRIDTGTSGVLVYARTRREAARLSAAFANHEFEKRYVAVVGGRLETELTLQRPVGRTSPATFGVAEGGRAATTIVRPLEQTTDGTKVEILITTGRTHQIRVHLSSAGYPLLGDLKYGGRPAARLMLHAARLAHPAIGAWEAPVPF
ncbi:MAG TPA: RluA family pseudouridine synthase [Thermoanaerobaculia bacterium]